MQERTFDCHVVQRDLFLAGHGARLYKFYDARGAGGTSFGFCRDVGGNTLHGRLGNMKDDATALTEQLQAMSHMKQDFLSSVSHEFRTPITTLQGYLMLLEQGTLGEISMEQREALQVALKNVNRLNRLVTDLLDFSSVARGKFLLASDVVDIANVLTQALGRAADAAQLKDIHLCYEPAESPGTVIGDEERLVQMITHLLENAVKFSRPGQQVMLTAQRGRHMVAIEVRDAGIGMTPEQLARAFTPFVQGESGLSRRFDGLGMGLSLIHNLVALHGGEIDIASEPGQGTTVTVTLPLLP